MKHVELACLKDITYLKPAGPLNISIHSRALLKEILSQFPLSLSALCSHVYIASASRYLELVTVLDYSY